MIVALFNNKFKTSDRENLSDSKKRVAEGKFKDLTPSNRKKRKEIDKPWGRLERLLVAAVIFGLVGAAVWLGIKSGAIKIAITRPVFIGEGVFESGVDTIDAKQRGVIEAFNKETASLAGTYAFVVVRLDGGISYGVNTTTSMVAASLNKLPIMVALLRGFEDGSISATTQYSLSDRDKVGGIGDMTNSTEGTVFSYGDLLELMGKQSDNTAAAVAKKIVGEERIQSILSDCKMNETSLSEDRTTALDSANLFICLNSGKVISLSGAQRLYAALTDTDFESLIPQVIDADIQIAHKYGREVGVLNDAGIVFAAKPFVLVFLSKSVNEDAAMGVVHSLVSNVLAVENQP